MDSLFLLQFACFIFMLINAIFVALSHLYVRWVNKRYERSRWMVVFAMIGLAIQYVIQMAFGFRAADDILGAVVNILIYTPCFSLIAMAIYKIETTPQEDEPCVWRHLCCHPPGILGGHQSPSQPVYQGRGFILCWFCSA